MFRMSFDQSVAEIVEENFLSMLMRTQVSACIRNLHPCVHAHDLCVHRLSSYVRIRVLQFIWMHDPTYICVWHPCLCKCRPACTC